MVKLKQFYAWIIKHKKANHIVVRGIYQTKMEAEEDYNSMPELDNNGCGKRGDYEIKRVVIRTK